ncbi:MAG: ABC transporter ATP-binding protein [Thermomonas sp.]|uniref:ABC transporter ATP-binding protein n=1 Tax=Thermomonas sp. TaxID=1971895 RepID=UPI0039E44E87
MNIATISPLQATGLYKHYEGRCVLDGVTLALAPGRVLGLIGRNGAGKSTLIRIMLGLIEPDAGEAMLWGQPSLALDDAAKARLGYVPQQPEALPWLKIGDMLDFVGRFYPQWDHAFVDATLQRWSLPRNRMLGKLSPGERQRIALIRALASRPELLVLDEPAAALDPVARRELLREIALRAGESGTTVLFSTHIVSDLERVASHVAFMHAGKVLLHVEMDTLKECHLRLHIPAAAASQLTGKVPGEIARRKRENGTLSLVIVREEGAPWPALAEAPGVHAEVLSLEDLFVEVAE